MKDAGKNGQDALRALLGSVVLLLLLSLAPAGPLPAPAGAAPIELATIDGRVTYSDDSGVADAEVSAARSGFTHTAPTEADGSYTLELPSGTYALSVRPASVGTNSPDWVYTGESVNVSVPPDTTQNFVVETASVTVIGQLIAPNSAPFDAPNRAWVRAENQEGHGNTVQVASDGSFAVKVLPGIVLLSLTFENDLWAAPVSLSGAVYYAEAGETITVDPLQVLVKEATISGTVQVLGGGAAPAGVPVRAWRLDGADFEQTFTDLNGNYSLAVITGTWALRAVPLADLPYGAAYYVPAEPPQRVQLTTSDATVTRDLLIAEADVTVNGTTVDAGNGEPLPTSGRAYSGYRDEQGRPGIGPTAAIDSGTFTLRLSSTVAQTYTIGVYFPPDVPYTGLDRSLVLDASPGATRVVTIPVTTDNSHITGALRNRDGEVVTGVPGAIYGASDSGGWARTRVNPVDGTYDLNVATTDITGAGGSFWRVRAFVDPTSGYLVQRPRVQRVFLPYNDGAGSTIEGLDFTLASVAEFGSISGVVSAPDPTAPGGERPLPGVRVHVRELTGDSSAIVRWAYTDRQGRYEVRVPSGSYRVSASYGEALRRRHIARRLVAPVPATATVAAQASTSVDLLFRLSDASVSGNVVYAGAPHAALVRARSADGVTEYAYASDDGAYVLHLASGISWELQAVSSEGSEFLRSQALSITPEPSTTPAPVGDDLELTVAAPIPDSQAFVFEASQDQIFTMSDGSQVQVPAGALAPSGTVVLTVRPLPELADDGGAEPVSFGYRLHAFDDQGRPITRFLRPVTLVIPFTAEQLAALGIAADQLVPAYWDEASASWKPVENVVVTTDDSGNGLVQIEVDHFTDFALLGAPGGTIYIPLLRTG